MNNSEYEALLKESKWGGELARTERGKCSEEGQDFEREHQGQAEKQKMCLWSRCVSKSSSHGQAEKANTASGRLIRLDRHEKPRRNQLPNLRSYPEIQVRNC